MLNYDELYEDSYDTVNWWLFDQGESPNYYCQGCDYADEYGCTACCECSEYKD